MKFKDYQILRVHTLEGLEQKVKHYGEDGWVLVGGPIHAGGDWWAQAMVVPCQ